MPLTDTAHRRTADRPSGTRKPRLGFLGLGWIGRHRLQSVVDARAADVIAVADCCHQAGDAAAMIAPQARRVAGLKELLHCNPDGVVIATPSALHAEQCLQTLEAGVAVFCQKPLARTAEETAQILDAAARAGLPLGVDLCYRHLAGVQEIRELVRVGTLGTLFAADLVFHNAYGPDKPWFWQPELSGGGCLIDLGTHLLDLLLWIAGEDCGSDVRDLHSVRYSEGRQLRPGEAVCEDYAAAGWTGGSGLHARLACSWGLPAGCDAVIEATICGTQGSVSVRNVNGSFYDFVVEHREGTQTRQLAGPPDAWGGRAVLEWIDRLNCRDAEPDGALLPVARLLDAMYER